ncbi:Protein of unknown function [Lactobacillus equicursoris 66c]|uniref:Uncharacterized protein n=1 Tax=Lactobacillus equicursoris 66c TaxID=872326 RepID=K0NUG2_9LACO|nr:hypothetical protein [Lactobacillus equicursoris]CCK82920.1 Protein of unknown function [Lactobacillus equicursoris 66c]
MKTIEEILTNAIEANQEEQRIYGNCQAAQASAELTWYRLTQVTPAAYIRKVDPDEVFSGTLDLAAEKAKLAEKRGLRSPLLDRWEKQTAVVLRIEAIDNAPQFSIYQLAKTRSNQDLIFLLSEMVAAVLSTIGRLAEAVDCEQKAQKEALDEYYYVCYENQDLHLIKENWKCIPAMLGADDEEEAVDATEELFKWRALDNALYYDFKDQPAVDADQLQEVLAKSYEQPISAEELKHSMKAMLWQYNQTDNTFTKSKH